MRLLFDKGQHNGSSDAVDAPSFAFHLACFSGARNPSLSPKKSTRVVCAALALLILASGHVLAQQDTTQGSSQAPVTGISSSSNSSSTIKDTGATASSRELSLESESIARVQDKLSAAAVEELKRLCLPVQFRSDAAAYRACVEKQLARLGSEGQANNERPPLSFNEQYIIQQACSSRDSVGSEQFRRCEAQQLATLAGSQPALLDLLGGDEPYAVRQICLDAQALQGVRAYRDCLNEAVRRLLVMPRPNLSSLSRAHRSALQARCSTEAGTAVAYRRCLLDSASSMPLVAAASDLTTTVDPGAVSIEPAIMPLGFPENDLAARELANLSQAPKDAGTASTPAAVQETNPATLSSIDTGKSPLEAAPTTLASEDSVTAALEVDAQKTSTQDLLQLDTNGARAQPPATAGASETLALARVQNHSAEPPLGQATSDVEAGVDEYQTTTESTTIDDSKAGTVPPASTDALVDELTITPANLSVSSMLARIQQSVNSFDSTNKLILAAAVSSPLLLTAFWLLMPAREQPAADADLGEQGQDSDGLTETVDLSAPRRATSVTHLQQHYAGPARHTARQSTRQHSPHAPAAMDADTQWRADRHNTALSGHSDQTVLRPVPGKTPATELTRPWASVSHSGDWPAAANEVVDNQQAAPDQQRKADPVADKNSDAESLSSGDHAIDPSWGKDSKRSAQAGLSVNLDKEIVAGEPLEHDQTQRPKSRGEFGSLSNSTSEPVSSSDTTTNSFEKQETQSSPSADSDSAVTRKKPSIGVPGPSTDGVLPRSRERRRGEAGSALLSRNDRQEAYLAWLGVQDDTRQASLAIEFLIYWMAYADERYPPSLRLKIMQMKDPSDIDRIKRWVLMQDVHAFAANLHWLQQQFDSQQKEQTIRLLMALLVNENALTPSQHTLLRFLADAFGLGLERLAELYLNAFAQMLPDMPRPDKPAWWRRQATDNLKRWDGRSVARQKEDIQHRVRLGLPLGVALDELEILHCYHRASKRCDPESFHRLPPRTRSLALNQSKRFESAAQSLLEVCA